MTIFGWDMSHFDAPSIGNAIAEGISFVTHKAGGDANDPELAAWWAGVKGHRDQLLLGAYWVLYPGNPVYRAELFLSRLDSQCPGWRDGPFVLQADCEEWNQNPATVPSRAEIAAFCDRLVSRMPKLRPVVYAPKWVYDDKLTGLGYPLWASSYVTASGPFKAIYPGDGSVRWGAYSGQTPAILQYADKAVIGGQTTSDANAFRGTLAQLTDLVAPGWSVDVATAISKDDLAAIAQATASKIHEDLINPKSGLAQDQAASEQRIVAGVTAAGKPVSVAEIVSGVLAGFDPKAIAAAIPADMAQQVVDLLAARLAS